MIPALLLSLMLQAAPAPDRPAAAPPSAPAADRAAVIATIDALFAALEAGDGAALLGQVHAEGRLTGVGEAPNGTSGVRKWSFAEYAGRLKPDQGFVERIARPMIEIDADIAMVWAPFTIVADGKVKSCGFDHFDLVREGGRWKVVNLTFSARTDCASAPR